MGTEVNPEGEDADLGNFFLPALGDVYPPSIPIPSFFLLDINSSAGAPSQKRKGNLQF